MITQWDVSETTTSGNVSCFLCLPQKHFWGMNIIFHSLWGDIVDKLSPSEKLSTRRTSGWHSFSKGDNLTPIKNVIFDILYGIFHSSANFSFCGASKAERHLGITLSVVHLSHFWFAYNFFTLIDRALDIWHVCSLWQDLSDGTRKFWSRDLDCDLWPTFAKL